MGIINSNKSISNVTDISCQGTLNMTIGITAAPDIISNPTDIVLILDRSGSMSGQALVDMKTAVNTFIDIIATSTGGAPDLIGSGSHIGIVSFADTAIQNTDLITSVADLKSAASSLVAGGSTNHSAAFVQATSLLNDSVNNKVMIMFTDGETTVGPNPSPFAAVARAQGITIYCIGLIGSGGIDINALNDWATDPNITHVAIAPDSSQLDQLFADLAENLSVPGATNVLITEIINPDFIISSPPMASVGTISQLTPTSFQWTIDQLGTVSTESATVVLSIQHVALTTGIKHVNQLISYSDAKGSIVSFADPTVFVDCTPVFPVDSGPIPIDVPMTGCEDFVEFNAGDLVLGDGGRILDLDINILNVCPNKRVALAVVLTQLDETGTPQPCGMKTITIPAHTLPVCSDILVTCIRFILPDDGTSPCESRDVRAQFFAHYIDNAFVSCLAPEVGR